jgi:hypothetical protein
VAGAGATVMQVNLLRPLSDPQLLRTRANRGFYLDASATVNRSRSELFSLCARAQPENLLPCTVERDVANAEPCTA